MKTSKKLMGEIIAKLNKEGYTGGFYHYKKGECSCCYGLNNVFFEVNENMPNNWIVSDDCDFYYRIMYKTDDKDTDTAFRKLANKLASKYFGKRARTAESNYQCIIISGK